MDADGYAMKKIILAFMLIAFAVCSYGAEYEMVMFKCGIKGGKTIEPNISESLSKMGLNASYEYDDNSAYVFAIVKNDINITELADANKLLPLSLKDEEKYSKIITQRKLDAYYDNNPSERPAMLEWSMR
jgi:hypothetical protein